MPTPKALCVHKVIGNVMKSFKTKDLHSGSSTGPIVKNQKQAIAIAIRTSNEKCKEYRDKPIIKRRKRNENPVVTKKPLTYRRKKPVVTKKSQKKIVYNLRKRK